MSDFDKTYDPTVNYAEKLEDLGLGQRTDTGFKLTSQPSPDVAYCQALMHISVLDDEDFLNIIHRALLDRPGVKGRQGEHGNSQIGAYAFDIAPITYNDRTTPARQVTILLQIKEIPNV